ncbi:DUF2878 domain-containing protein [Thalassotalea sp. LPB0316]|uniref:DUF2878 domain-containing protein n=1 Tax=Thalassotalea sp. LPB0316 TaxID=2769490 RepID=UPI0018668B1E|nr:DUF2878 domain-containing protein [Thalassotalea sp. LPB0316]QOL25549.1 DUF2878 domain-containing protein [Thalassotalea sp. LPB0316]
MWLVNNLGFNAIWFSAIFLGNTALALGVPLLIAHCWYYRARNELSTLLQVVVIGILVDSTLMHFGVFKFAEQSVLIPVWLMLIWAAFGATLNHSLAFLKDKKTLTLLVGFCLPPLSYLAGEKFGAVSFGYSTPYTLAILAVIWSPLLYGLFRISYVKPQTRLA